MTQTAATNDALDLLRQITDLERGLNPQPRPLDLHDHLRTALQWHGLVPPLLQWAHAFDLGPDDARWLSEMAMVNAARSLRMAGSTAFAHGALRSHGVSALSLKGVPLSLRTTGRLDGRVSTDVDVLVPLESLTVADRALREAGYVPEGALSHPSGGRFRRWAAISGHHLAYTHPSQAPVELHWDASMPRLLPWSFDSLWERRRIFDLSGVDVAGLGDTDEIIHSAVHGSVHRYERLAWLLDFCRLVRSAGPATWSQAIERAADFGVSRSLAMAAAMAIEIDPAIPQPPLSTADRRAVAYLRRCSWRVIAAGSRRTTRIRVDALISTLQLRAGLPYRIAGLAGTLAPLHQLEASRAPGATSFLTVPLRAHVPRRFRRLPHG